MSDRSSSLSLSRWSSLAFALVFIVGCGSSSNGTGAGGASGSHAGAGGGAAGSGTAGGGSGGGAAGSAAAGTDGGAAGSAAAGADGGSDATAGTDGAAGSGAAGADAGRDAADGGSDAAAGADGGGSDVVADAGTDVPTACNTIVNAATTIQEMNVAAAFPAGGTGGPLAEGTYYRTGAQFYTGVGGASGPSGKVRKETLLVTSLGNSMFIVEDIDSKNGAADQRSTQTSTVSGANIMVGQVCPPSSGTAAFTYTSAAGTFTIYNALNNPPEVATFTKQ